MKPVLRFFIILAFSLFAAQERLSATHIYGADFFYSHVSGNTYTITLVVYGDCNISPGATFLTLSSANPEVQIWNGNVRYLTTNLFIQNPSAGVEVTPVCTSQLNNTTCSGGSIPGVKKFTYSRNVTLNTLSSNWKFIFDGRLSNNSSAGRSNSITNIIFPPPSNSTTMRLEATLNNLSTHNSSPVYTTIPTPFFCINKASGYNPGTVDPNNDNLVYSLVAGLDAATGSTVGYNTGYSATNPLAVATGTYSFSPTTGQLNFTPNAVQRSLVVTKVEEYRGTTLVGSSMREMTFVVLNNCNNNTPGGVISNVTGGMAIDTNSLKICRSTTTANFAISPTDADNDVIGVQISGLPSWAGANINNNNTTSPTINITMAPGTAAPGAYNFFVSYTDNGCPLSSKQTVAYTIYVLPDPTVDFELIERATCLRKARFKMTPSPADTSPPWTISILQGSTTLHNFPGVTASQEDSLVPGTYTLRVTNNNGCFKDSTIIIDPPPPIVPSVTMVKPTCFGDNDGSITITASGGAPFTYKIGAGAFSSVNTFTGLSAGTYTLYVQDTNYCIKDTTVILEDPTKMTASVGLVSPPCNFFNSGVITVTGLNGSPPYQYALGAGAYSSINMFSGLFSGNYMLHIKDAKNCVLDTLVELPDLIYVHADAMLTHVLCNGDATGAITLNAFGATAPYKYQLGSGTLSATNTFTGLPAGMHSFHIEDVNQCYLDTVIEITEPTALSIPSVVSHISCHGQVDGSISINGAGGVPPYSYASGAGIFGPINSFTGLAKGSYSFSIKDANGCIKDTTINIIEPAVLGIGHVQVTEPNCSGGFNGMFTITATGGWTPYSYTINTSGVFGPSSTITGVSAGTYTLTVRDARNCLKDTLVSIGEPTPVGVTAAVKQSTCATLANGRVTLTGSGGVPGYTYALNSGSFGTSPAITPIPAGLHTLRVRDSKGCIKDTAITIIDSLVVQANANVADVSCFGLNNGSVSFAPSGGISPYQFARGTGGYQSTAAYSNLTPGSYTFHIKDVNGCTVTENISITEPSKLRISAGASHIACYGDRTGIVNIGGSGGTTPYTFAKGSGSFGTSGNFTMLEAGTHVFHIKDSRNCVVDTTIFIVQPPALQFDLDITNVLCFGESSGKVVVHPSGGTPGYMYSFDNNLPQLSNELTGIPGGTRAIHLRDANGCQKDTLIVLSVPPPFKLTGFSFKHPICQTSTDGEVTLSGNGGTEPYTYGYVNGPSFNSSTITGLTEGSYSFYIKDANGCIVDTAFVLRGISDLGIASVMVTNPTCFGLSNGRIVVTPVGGRAPFTYALDNASPTSEPAMGGLARGTYTVSVRDSLNCFKDTVISVTEPEELVAEATVLSINDCEDYDNGGHIRTNVSGGTMPYNYRWLTDPPHYLADLTGLGNGVYRVAVSDFNNCADTTGAEIIYDDCCKIVIPDAFTPNGDGKNDKAKFWLKGQLSLKHFSIYNRFGQMVFTTTNVNEGWDGSFNGEPLDLGTYTYYMQGTCGSNKPVEYKGTITLVR